MYNHTCFVIGFPLKLVVGKTAFLLVQLVLLGTKNWLQRAISLEIPPRADWLGDGSCPQEETALSRLERELHDHALPPQSHQSIVIPEMALGASN